MSIDFFLKTLEDEGFSITANSKILDFGCGNGSFVKKLRDKNYDAYGCDLQFKEGPDIEQLSQDQIVQKINTSPYRLPYDDNQFDYVFSETVFEHVQNTEETIAEIHRVLKPNGASLHYFPAKYGLMESHIHLPFASVLNAYPILLFWAILGFRKKKQKGLSAKETAMANKKYLENSTNYLSTKEIQKAFKKNFPTVRFVEKTAIHHSTSRSTVLLARYLSFIPGLPFLYRTFKAVIVLTQK